MPLLSSRGRYSVNVWPGFVDALASVLLVFLFMLLLFVVGQFFLTDILLGRDRALDQLNKEISALASTLSMERERTSEQEKRIDQLSRRLETTLTERDQLSRSLTLTKQRAQTSAAELEKLKADLVDAEKTILADKSQIKLKLREIASLQEDIATLREVREELETKVSQLSTTLSLRDEELMAARDRSKALAKRLADGEERTRLAQKEIDKRDIRIQELTARIASVDQALVEEQELSKQGQAQVALLNQQIAALRKQISTLSAALALSETEVEEQKVELEELGKRLNIELARKVQELNRYRSEFFGRLREVLGEHPDIRIVGDRFLFQSELLFDTASAELGPSGRRQLAQLAETLKEVAGKIPPDIQWILRIDGHTDRRSINTEEFPSNWELSTARALSIVNFLIEQGIPPERLAAAGFGEFHPLDKAKTKEAYSRNRRIEIKLTGR